MEESSTGVLVPAVKTDAWPISSLPQPASATDAGGAAECAGEDAAYVAELDRDLTCPICMQLIKDAFLTACGHSFCYMCIVTHLQNKSDCPCCGRHLTSNQLFPNFLLDKLLKKASARQISRTASPVEQFRLALQQTGM